MHQSWFPFNCLLKKLLGVCDRTFFCYCYCTACWRKGLEKLENPRAKQNRNILLSPVHLLSKDASFCLFEFLFRFWMQLDFIFQIMEGALVWFKMKRMETRTFNLFHLLSDLIKIKSSNAFHNFLIVTLNSEWCNKFWNL